MIYTSLYKRLVTTQFRTSLVVAAAVAVVLGASAPRADSATINFSSLEVGLSEPENLQSMHYALWSGWMTQVYEYNMPFLEIANGAADTNAITSFKMSIGDTSYQFANEFDKKSQTNSWNVPATGEYALLGATTPGIAISSSIADGGDTLVVNFGNGGLKPGETVRFQVDINADNLDPGMMMYGSYTGIFFDADGGADTTGNSEVMLSFAGTNATASATLPNYSVPNAVSLTTPRPYTVMQMIDPLVPLDINDPVPEPTSLLLLASAGLGFGFLGRRVHGHYQPVEKRPRGFFQPRQAQSKLLAARKTVA